MADAHGNSSPDESATDWEKRGFENATQAVYFDSAGQVDAAIYFYSQAAHSLLNAAKLGSAVPNINEKATQYYERAEELSNQKYATEKRVTKSEQQLDLERAQFLLLQAFEEDENENIDEAVDLYAEATELCLKARGLAKDGSLQEKLSSLAKQALDRAEVLKGARAQEKPKLNTKLPTSTSERVVPPLGIEGLSLNPTVSTGKISPRPGASKAKVSGSDSFTKEEIAVLRKTSTINSREYVPFMAVDLRERFGFPMPFSDKDGKLALSLKQRQRFGKWARPDEFCDEPCMISKVDCFTIRQTIVSDCSFVASLAVSSRYENRFKKRLITNIIYPQNKQGYPVYNPCGKYMVKLNLNGVPRKIVVDDYLPMGKHGELLCSFSSNRNELWISLLEKAYMKVMGGYDFPGSNSNIDLHALTGWIPERISIRPGSADFNSDQVFSRMFDRFHSGGLLCTVATGELGEREADRAGLVTTHAYAMLDIREVQGNKLFLLKNPWSHMRWKGNYSEMDTVHWTESMKTALKYDPKNAEQFDDGVFWIDYESICKFFDVFYLNWNPSLFQYTYCIHDIWVARGPVKDQYTVGENPQYRLDVKVNQPPSACWILLTRHIMDKDDFAENKEFITVLVYKGGKRVYYPYDPPPYIDGTRINSPHYLCKMTMKNGGTSQYTLVISEYEKVSTIYYTLRIYSASPFRLSKIQDEYRYVKKVTDGKWTANTAGGCGNYRDTYNRNPIYQIELKGSGDNNKLLIDLKGPKQYNVGFDIVTVSTDQSSSSPHYFRKKASGDFRTGFCYLELDNVLSGVYNVIPCTFQPGQQGPFFLLFKATCPITANQLQ